MKWTTDKPTRPGWYWIDDGVEVWSIKLIEVDGQLGESITSDHFEWVADINAIYWMGPQQEPYRLSSIDYQRMIADDKQASSLLADLVKRCHELDYCLRNRDANNYDGATTRALWRQSVKRAKDFMEKDSTQKG